MMVWKKLIAKLYLRNSLVKLLRSNTIIFTEKSVRTFEIFPQTKEFSFSQYEQFTMH